MPSSPTALPMEGNYTDVRTRGGGNLGLSEFCLLERSDSCLQGFIMYPGSPEKEKLLISQRHFVVAFTEITSEGRDHCGSVSPQNSGRFPEVWNGQSALTRQESPPRCKLRGGDHLIASFCQFLSGGPGETDTRQKFLLLSKLAYSRFEGNARPKSILFRL